MTLFSKTLLMSLMTVFSTLFMTITPIPVNATGEVSQVVVVDDNGTVHTIECPDLGAIQGILEEFVSALLVPYWYFHCSNSSSNTGFFG